MVPTRDGSSYNRSRADIFGMRKLTVIMDTSIMRYLGPYKLFEDVERIEGRQLIRFDPAEGMKLALLDIILKPGRSLEDLSLPDSIKILDVLMKDGQRNTCVVKIQADERLRGLIHLFDLDLIFVPPLIADGEKVMASFVSDDDRLRRLMSALRLIGIVKEVHIGEFTLPDESVLSVLTERQREVLSAAKRLGYYEVPRRATTKDVAKELGISKATTVEHIRKAERRLIEQVLVGI